MAAKKFDAMLAGVLTLSVDQQLAIISAITANLQSSLGAAKPAAKLAAKLAAKPAKAAKAKVVAVDDEEDEPKSREIPPHLKYYRDWNAHVLTDAKKNGWDSFEMKVTKHGKSEMVEMNASEEDDEGVHVFAETHTQFTHSHAMSLGAKYKRDNHLLWQAWIKSNPLPETKPKVAKPAKAEAAKAETDASEAAKPKAAKPKTVKSKKAAEAAADADMVLADD